MDPVTQGVLGASLPQALSGNKEPGPNAKYGRQVGTITWMGCLAGMAPDLDVFIRSSTDPILFLEFHRGFTHALAFIPIGALICAAAFYPIAKRVMNFGRIYLVCLLGYATHGLLDACTTYGTQLFWPFSDIRIAWNNISVVDPLFTVPMLALAFLTVRRANPMFARIALIWGLTYLLLGVVQRERAETIGEQYAASEGLNVIRLEAKPGFANLFLWKIVMETETEFHVDAVRLYLEPKYFHGDAVKKLSVEDDLPWLDPASQQAADIARFDWFSNRYLALDSERPNFIVDIRYSLLPNEINALWGIEVDPGAGPTDHARWVTDRSARRVNDLLNMLID
jgi:inner membrane protein